MGSEVIGSCPICDRDMIKDRFVDKHHLIPKCKNGRHTPTIVLHRICHSKIHSIWTEADLAGYYHTVERIKEHPDMQKFIKWVSRKPPEFYEKTKMSNARRR